MFAKITSNGTMNKDRTGERVHIFSGQKGHSRISLPSSSSLYGFLFICLFLADIMHTTRGFFCFCFFLSLGVLHQPNVQCLSGFMTQNYWFLPSWDPHLSAPLRGLSAFFLGSDTDRRQQKGPFPSLPFSYPRLLFLLFPSPLVFVLKPQDICINLPVKD